MAQFIKGKQIAQQTVTISGNTGNVVVLGDLDLDGNFVIATEVPTSDFHLTNKEYVDAVAQGLLPHEPVMVISTSNITREGLLTIDGYDLEAGDRVLVAGQTNAAQNGIFVASVDPWERAEDADGDPEHEISVGDFVYIRSGATFASSGWVLARTDGSNKQEITPEVDTQEWFQITAPGSFTADGQGLKLFGNEFFIDLDGNTLSQSASGLRLSTSVETVISTNVTNITSLSTAVSTETSLRTSADASLTSEIDDVVSDLSVESSIRASADTSLEGAITSNVTSIDTVLDAISGTTADLSSLETQVSTNVEDITSLESEIDDVVSDLSVESSVRASADTSLASEIDDVVSDLDVESSIRTSADTSLSTAISNEVEDRISGDNSLEDEIITLSGATLDIETILGEGELLGLVGGDLTGVTNIQTVLSVELSDSVDSIDTVLDAISGTTADLTSLETVVDQNVSDISSESSIRASADTSLASEIDDVVSDLDVESSIRASADTSLEGAITSNVTSIDNVLDAISGTTADLSSLETAVSNEISDRIEDVSSLESEIDDVVSDLSVESSIRASADTSLASEIDDVVSDLSVESSVRASADTSLENAISGLTVPQVYEEVYTPANAGDDDDVVVTTTAFDFEGELQDESVFVFLNGVKYRFTNTAGTGTTAFYADVISGAGDTTLFFNGVAAGFEIETDDEVILKFTAEE